MDRGGDLRALAEREWGGEGVLEEETEFLRGGEEEGDCGVGVKRERERCIIRA